MPRTCALPRHAGKGVPCCLPAYRIVAYGAVLEKFMVKGNAGADLIRFLDPTIRRQTTIRARLREIVVHGKCRRAKEDDVVGKFMHNDVEEQAVDYLAEIVKYA